MQTIGDILVSVTGGWQMSRTWVISGCDNWGTDVWYVSQHFLSRSKDRRLGLEPNSFSDGRQTDVEDSNQLGLETNSFSVGWRTDTWDSSWIGLEPNSFPVYQRTDVWDSSRPGLESINSFGHILCKEVPCLTVLGTRELKQYVSCQILWRNKNDVLQVTPTCNQVHSW